MIQSKIQYFIVFIFIAITTIVGTSIQADQTSYNTGNSVAVLYYHPACGHCHKVLGYLSSVKKTLPMKNTSNPKYQIELQNMGQKGVPVLVVNSQVISGANQIIDYLKEHPDLLK